MAKKMRLYNIPEDVLSTILMEQKRIKLCKRINQFSLEKTIYCMIREYSNWYKPTDAEIITIRERGCKKALLTTIPADIYKIILSEQNRIKTVNEVGQFSMERTIYHIIREYARVKAIKPSDNAL
jgi:hypothetical protein